MRHVESMLTAQSIICITHLEALAVHGGHNASEVHSTLRVRAIKLLQLLLAQLQEGIVVL